MIDFFAFPSIRSNKDSINESSSKHDINVNKSLHIFSNHQRSLSNLIQDKSKLIKRINSIQKGKEPIKIKTRASQFLNILKVNMKQLPTSPKYENSGSYLSTSSNL